MTLQFSRKNSASVGKLLAKSAWFSSRSLTGFGKETDGLIALRTGPFF